MQASVPRTSEHEHCAASQVRKILLVTLDAILERRTAAILNNLAHFTRNWLLSGSKMLLAMRWAKKCCDYKQLLFFLLLK